MAIAVDRTLLPWHLTGCGVNVEYCGIRWLQASRASFKFKHVHSRKVPSPRCSMKKEEPAIVRVAVSAMTALLGILPRDAARSSSPSPPQAEEEDISDPLGVLAADYKRSYFITGEFCSALYSEDCLFVDPTISFSGRETYRRNLKLLVPFLVDPSVELLSMAEARHDWRLAAGGRWREEVYHHLLDTEGGVATTGRTYVKLPWMPLINVDGSTVYDLDPQAPSRVTRHEERWSVPAWEAVRQLFVPSNRNP